MFPILYAAFPDGRWPTRDRGGFGGGGRRPRDTGFLLGKRFSGMVVAVPVALRLGSQGPLAALAS